VFDLGLLLVHHAHAVGPAVIHRQHEVSFGRWGLEVNSFWASGTGGGARRSNP
jgi:hypothetical protein